jgi:predicted nucleotidyltransferase
MSRLEELALEVGASGRTLRRAAARGTIHAARRSERRLELEHRELEYVRRHWTLLERALEVLRTQPGVRLAVLFGSISRGDERADSDVDLLVDFRETSLYARSLLIERLQEALGRRVQLVELESAEASPILLADVVRDGRVLVDRDDAWPGVRRRRGEIAAAAAAENERMTDELVAAFEDVFV